jgi:hypothetical protein
LRLESVPVVAGVLIGLVGLALLLDAALPEDFIASRNRRRRERSKLSAGGEGCIAMAIMCMAAALIGRDSWRYGTLTVILGALLFVIGAALNWSYLHERITNRGALRRGGGPAKPEPPRRIR